MNGPRERNQIDDTTGYLNFGAIWIPEFAGLDVTAEINPDSRELVSLSLIHKNSIAKLELFAAEKNHSSWTQTRLELAAKLEQAQVQPKITAGTFGSELRTVMPIFDEQGNALVQAVRFLGIDGDRWFLRITVSGLATSDDTAITELDELISKLVIDRGDEPMPPGARLSINFPKNSEHKIAPKVRTWEF